MPDKKKVLITGAAGLIGSLIRQELGDRYELSGVDIKDIPGFKNLVADTTDVNANSHSNLKKPNRTNDCTSNTVPGHCGNLGRSRTL